MSSQANSKNPYAIAIHGGAGTILRDALTPELEAQYQKALTHCLSQGEVLLAQGGEALEAVEMAIRALEDEPLFNAGRGAVFTAAGTHELDASIMRGDTLMAGAIAGVTGLRNPISGARAVMELTSHVLLAGQGAEAFLRAEGLAFEDPAYFHTELRHNQWLEVRGTTQTRLDHSELPAHEGQKFSTVGAVALDQLGNLAAGTSTGGMTNKRVGRIGDTPMIGAGTYADNRFGAVSCTGDGEFFIRAVVAYDVIAQVRYGHLNLEEAVRHTLHQTLMEIGGEGGLIAVTPTGDLVLDCNTPGMYRAWVKQGENQGWAIFK